MRQKIRPVTDYLRLLADMDIMWIYDEIQAAVMPADTFLVNLAHDSNHSTRGVRKAITHEIVHLAHPHEKHANENVVERVVERITDELLESLVWKAAVTDRLMALLLEEAIRLVKGRVAE